jgi:hypothetical protein
MRPSSSSFSSSFKITIPVCLLLAAMLAPLPAQDTQVEFSIVPRSSTVTRFRYQLGPPLAGGWIELDASDARMGFDAATDAQQVLYLQQASGDGGWSDSFQYRYEAKAGSYAAIPAVRLDSVDTGATLLWPQGECAMLYELAAGASLQANLSLRDHQRVSLAGGLSYSCGESSTDWVESFHLVGLGAGVGYRIPLGERLEIVAEVGYGLMTHLAYGDLSGTGSPVLASYFDQQAWAALRLVCDINARLGLYLAPTGTLFFERGEMGAMVGVQTGLRINL